jgi:Flp pilus assembly pilin Flp
MGVAVLRARLAKAKDQTGQAVVEYGILLAIISVAAVAFLPGLGGEVSTLYQTARDAIDAALP